MDREIPKSVLRKERKKKFTRYGIVGASALVVLIVLFSFLQSGVKRKDIIISKVDQGMINVSVSAAGKVIPSVEEVITSPINSRILEVYKRGGDSVEVGTPILKLDLKSTETEYNKMLDQQQMKRYEIQQLQAKTKSSISDLEMKAKVLEMQVNRKSVELKNERYLDSIGAGTSDKVREVELSYNVTKLEHQQLVQQLANSRSIAEAEMNVKKLDLQIFEKSLAEMKRTLEDAQIRSPRKAILTFINNQVGAQISAGQQVAIISDLSHFKIEGEIADSYGDRIAAGSKAIVKIGKMELPGMVSSLTPMSKNGVLAFTVQLEDDDNSRLRSGLKTDIHVMTSVREDVIRISNGPYYTGPGYYDLFVVKGNKLIRKKVRLGDSNYQYVEVLEGLSIGEEVVTSDMKQYKNKRKLSIK